LITQLSLVEVAVLHVLVAVAVLVVFFLQLVEACQVLQS
jgi:hypothetical protein